MHWARARQKPFPAAGMGIDKSGSMSVTPSTWVRIITFVTRSGFPDTVIEDDGIRVPAGQTLNYVARVSFDTAPGTGNTSSGRVMNGSTVVESKSNSATGTVMDFSGTLVGTGELVTLEGYATSTGGRGTINSNTFLTLTP